MGSMTGSRTARRDCFGSPAASRSVLLAAALALAAGCASEPPPDDDPVILSHRDQVVRRSAFDRHLAAVEAHGELVVDSEVRQALFQAFIEERVVVLEARVRGLVAEGSPPEDERFAAQQLLAEASRQAAPVAEDDIARFFELHREEFQTSETVTLRQILVPTLNEARDLRRRLLKDRRSFETLARTRSRAPEASEAGLMGVYSRGELPSELEKIAFEMRVGGTSGIVITPLGYHVLRLDARQQARERTLEECQDEIRSRLEQDRSEAAARAFLHRLLAGAEVRPAPSSGASSVATQP